MRASASSKRSNLRPARSALHVGWERVQVRWDLLQPRGPLQWDANATRARSAIRPVRSPRSSTRRRPAGRAGLGRRLNPRTATPRCPQGPRPALERPQQLLGPVRLPRRPPLRRPHRHLGHPQRGQHRHRPLPPVHGHGDASTRRCCAWPISPPTPPTPTSRCTSTATASTPIRAVVRADRRRAGPHSPRPPPEQLLLRRRRGAPVQLGAALGYADRPAGTQIMHAHGFDRPSG